jgi:hypothetical protein
MNGDHADSTIIRARVSEDALDLTLIPAHWRSACLVGAGKAALTKSSNN